MVAIITLLETIKQQAELEVGILTQCIKSNTVQRKGRDQATLINIVQKVNAKLNGINHSFQSQLPT